MQAQAQGHISDQVIMQEASQVNVQLPVFAQQNENTSQSHMSNGGSPCGSWHIDDDVLALREYITETIFQLFQPTSPDWQPQLLDFVRCLEDNLFKGASSKEEYMDLNTLEQRLQTLSKWISPVNCTKSLAQNAAASAGAIIKSPGISNIGNISPMSPNPVSDILSVSALGTSSMVHNPISMEKMFPAASGTRQEHGNKFMAIDSTAYDCSLGVYMLPQAGEVNSTFQLQQGIGAALMGTGNRMVPKVGMPGFGSQTVPSATLNTSYSMPTAVSSCGAGYAIVDSMATSQTKGNNINGSLDHHLCNVNGQITITMASNIQQENSSYGARNGGTDSGMHWIGNYKPSNTSQYVNQQMSSKQDLNQQRQQHFTQRDGCSTYIADFASNGNFYNSTSSRGLADVNSLFVNSEESHSSNDLGSQQNTLQEKKQIEQSQFQCLDNSQQIKFVTSLSVLPRGQSLQSQQRQQYPNQQQKFQLQQHQQQQYQHEQLKFHQHQQRNYQPQQPKFLQHRYPHYQHRQIQGQQHSLSNSEGEQKAQPASECFGLKQVGIGLPHLEVLQSQGELLQHEHQHFSQPPSKLLQLSGKFPQVQETLGQEVHHNSISPWQLHQQHTQQPQQLEASSSQQQQQIQPQIYPFGHPSEVQPSGWSSGITELEQRQYIKQQQLLLFIHHGSKCSDAEGECQTLHCSMAKLLWAHVTKCHNDQCLYPRCPPSRTLLSHHLHCHDFHCPVCVPVRQSIAQQHACSSNSRIVDFANGTSKSISVNDTVGTDVCLASRPVISVQGGGQIQQPPQKKPKVESASACQEHVEAQEESVLNANKMQVTSQMQPQANQQSGQSPGVVKPEALVSSKSKTAPAKMDLVVSSQHGISQRPSKSKKNAESKHEQVQSKNSVEALKVEPTAVVLNKVSAQAKQEAIQVQQMVVQAKQAAVRKVPASEISGTEKLGRTKVKGVSLMELFTPEQIKDHITGLQQWIGQSKGKAEKSQEVKHQLNENTCQLCMAQRLTFEPPPIYCTPCGTRIKRNAMYYSVDIGDTRNYFCVSCYNGVQGDTIRLDGVTHLKSKLKERENEEEIEEAWVQCDKCEAWQHQICALFNARRNESGKVDYTCPNCYMMEIERGKRKPLPQSAVLGAKDLPRTYLSDHIEQRLSRRLKQERQERAKALGKGYEEVPGAEALVVRVVSSIDKKVEVKQHFLEFYHDEDYPIELPYKSKVLLLFQKIEGVEVCLFGMYAQEFGSDCSHPNQRRVNISYLDSVKYFRPDVKTVTGEALRTLVYHEIMIGYLDYCKKRGFASCYIWACPPLKGEDYIFYCHPEIQKTPKCDKLREWYLAMLRKAAKENIVVDVTNLYDYFFTCTNECNAKVTAARLPYFDGDYWPGAVEDAIKQLQLEKEEGRKHEKNQKMKNSTIKWNSKAAAKAEFARNSSKDALLMKKLGESAYPMKDDLIMVHLRHACTRCRLFILSGKRWVCNQCKNFHLCDKCCEADKKLDKQDRHPISSMEKHVLYPIEVTNVPVDTKDADEIMESEFFDTRQAFLSLCQGNHYQYDTLRRAKHSSMMILYHLHNPTAPAFVSTCNVCHHDIETGQGWRCETCPDFDICSACYQNNGFMDHPHKLTPHPSMAEQNAQNQEARQERVLQLRKMLDLLVHASQCCSPRCQYTNCRRVKGLFRHGTLCKIRASGGCSLCKKMWYLLQLHGRACKASECRVPHCKDLRKHLRRLQQQMESRRRASVMEMMRRRVAGAAANSD